MRRWWAAALEHGAKRPWRWLDDRVGILERLEPLLYHRVPPGTAVGKSGWMYVLGFAVLGAFAVQGVTGVALATMYIPSPAHAYESLRFITEDSGWGSLVRGMHFYGASAMVLLLLLHMARVFLTGSYKFPREMSWITGVALLVLTMALAFTGQLLRWNQDGVWSVSVAATFYARVPVIGEWLGRFILAGDTLGGATLSRFFALHVFILPGLVVIIIAVHLYLVLRNGISEPPRGGHPVNPQRYRRWYERMLKRRGLPYWPDAAWQEAVFVTAVILAIVLLAFVVGPPAVGAPPDPTIVEANPKPDWYLLWYYALLAVYPRGLETAVMVYVPLLILLSLFLLPFIGGRGERSPRSRPWAVGIVGAAFFGFGALTILGMQAPWVPEFDPEPIPVEVIGATTGPVYEGALVFRERGCQYCHAVGGFGGEYGPDLTNISDRLPREVIMIRTLRGIGDMPAFADILTTAEMEDIIAFLEGHAARGDR